MSLAVNIQSTCTGSVKHVTHMYVNMSSRRPDHCDQLTEIANLCVTIMVEENVFWLQIPVRDHVSMTVGDGGDNLLEQLARLQFWNLQLNNRIIKIFILRVVMGFKKSS